jgi:S-disulfanyl-L-cysteine oxidoreductase SoxD
MFRLSVKATAISVAALALLAGLGLAQAGGYGGPYSIGSPASKADIAAYDTDIRPDGGGLPPGSGTYAAGKDIYMSKCVHCHGEKLGGNKEAPPVNGVVRNGGALIGGKGTLNTTTPKLTIQSFWPYAPTVFDFTKRAMPFDQPGSLTDDEVYSVTAFILGEAGIIKKSMTLNAKSLSKVKMPNRDGFVSDPRPEVYGYD